MKKGCTTQFVMNKLDRVQTNTIVDVIMYLNVELFMSQVHDISTKYRPRPHKGNKSNNEQLMRFSGVLRYIIIDILYYSRI